MIRKWTEINESMIATREADIEFTSDMSELDASLAISEAVSFAAEGKYIAEGLFRDILSFNKKAEDMNYSTMEYIAEAFDIKGVFGRIIDFLVKIWGSIVNFFKGLFSESSSSGGSSKGAAAPAAVNKVKEHIEETALVVINELKQEGGSNTNKPSAGLPYNKKEAKVEDSRQPAGLPYNKKETKDEDSRQPAGLPYNKKESKDDYYRNKAKEGDTSNSRPKPKQATAAETKAKAKEKIKPVASSRIAQMEEQMLTFHEMISKIMKECGYVLGNHKTKGVKYNRTFTENGKEYDAIFGMPLHSLSTAVRVAIGKPEDLAKSDLGMSIQSMKSLLDGAGADKKQRVKLNKDVFERLGRYNNGMSIINESIKGGGVKGSWINGHIKFYEANKELYNAKSIPELLSKFSKHMDEGSKDVTVVDTGLEWIKSLTSLTRSYYVENLDTLAKNAETIFKEVSDMKARIGSLSTTNNPDMSSDTIDNYNKMSSQMMAYQTSIQEILTRLPGFIIQGYQKYLNFVSNEYNRFTNSVLVRLS